MKGSKYTPGEQPSWRQKRAVRIAAWLAVALLTLGAGVATAVAMTRHSSATGMTFVTTTVRGKVVTLRSGKKIIRVPAKTVIRKGKRVTIPAHTIAFTDTQYVTSNGTVVLTAPPRTVTGPGGTKTVITTSTVSVPTTVTGPGSTVTVTLPGTTVTQPGTTVTQTVPVTITETVTVPTTVTTTVTTT